MSKSRNPRSHISPARRLYAGTRGELARCEAEMERNLSELEKRNLLYAVIWGGSRIKEGHPTYTQALVLGGLLGAKGIPVMTGGGPGVMEAANKGAHPRTQCLGLSIVSNKPHEKHTNLRGNPFLSVALPHAGDFTVRNWTFEQAAGLVFVFPGGYGTFNELFGLLTHLQMDKAARRVPVILMERPKSYSQYWGRLRAFIREEMIDEGLAEPEDIDRFKIMRSPSGAARFADYWWRRMHYPRFNNHNMADEAPDERRTAEVVHLQVRQQGLVMGQRLVRARS